MENKKHITSSSIEKFTTCNCPQQLPKMGHTLSTRKNSSVPTKLLDGPENIRADYGKLSLRHLREALDIYQTTLRSSTQLTAQEFDQVFGIMMGDAETHFELLSGRAELRAAAGHDATGSTSATLDKLQHIDPITVFLTLTMLVPAPTLAQLSFVYEVVTGSTAADAGLNAEQVELVLAKGVAGLCCLLGAKSPDPTIFRTTAKQLVRDADERSASTFEFKRFFFFLFLWCVGAFIFCLAHNSSSSSS